MLLGSGSLLESLLAWVEAFLSLKLKMSCYALGTSHQSCPCKSLVYGPVYKQPLYWHHTRSISLCTMILSRLFPKNAMHIFHTNPVSHPSKRQPPRKQRINHTKEITKPPQTDPPKQPSSSSNATPAPAPPQTRPRRRPACPCPCRRARRPPSHRPRGGRPARGGGAAARRGSSGPGRGTC